MDALAEILANPLVIAGLLVLALIVAGWLIRPLLKRWLVRRQEKAIEEIPIAMIEAPNHLDIEAYRRLRQLRVDIWKEWGGEQSLSPRALYDLSFDVVGRIAAIYHPEAPEPQYKATVDGLLDLNQRVVARLRGILDKPLIRSLRGLDVATIMTLKKGVDVVRANPVSSFLLRPKVRAATKVFFDVVNAFNPVHWGRRLLMDTGIETARRYFITSLVTIVGEEAVLLYSGRRTRNENAAREQAALTILARAIARHPANTVEELALFQRWLLRLRHVDAAVRLDLLAAVHKHRPPAPLAPAVLAMAGVRAEARRALAELAAQPAADAETRAQILREAEAELDRGSDAETDRPSQ